MGRFDTKEEKERKAALNAHLQTCNFLYGLREPVEGLQTIRDQLVLSGRYYNKLIEIERRRRVRNDEARLKLFPHFDAMCIERETKSKVLKELRTELKASQSKARSRAKGGSPELRERVKIAKAADSAIREQLKLERKQLNADPELKALYAANDVTANDELRAARKICGIYSGTYLLVEARAKSAQQTAKKPPDFKRFNGEGSVGAQIQDGMTWKEALEGKHARFRVREIRDLEKGAAAGHYRKIVEFSVRVASQDRKPVWAVCTGTLHRPLPEGALIKQVTIQCYRVTWQERWELLLTITVPRASMVKSGSATTGKVYIDLGWRVTDAGLLVATCKGDDGSRDQLVLPNDFVALYRKVDELQSLRDELFNSAKSRLLSWIAVRKQQNAVLPEWFAKATEHAPLWKSPNRMGELVRAWGSQRIDGDADIFTWLYGWPEIFPDGKKRYVGWYLQDCHLHDWQDHLRDQNAAHRKALYRKFATGLRKRFATCVIEDTDLRPLSTTPKPEEDKHIVEAQRYNQRVAAVHCLVDALKLCGPRQHVEVPTAFTTITCNLCSQVTRYDAGKAGEHVCEHCGAAWVKGDNAAANIEKVFNGAVLVPA